MKGSEIKASSKAKSEYEDYLNQFISQLGKGDHKESEIIWKLSSSKTKTFRKNTKNIILGGVKSNPRLLHIYNNYLLYYTNLPKDFKSNIQFFKILIF